MNCNQGDLARVVSYDEITAPHVGKIVRCVSPEKHPGYEELGFVGWLVDPPLTADLECVLDAALRPIRDPGDDARDETLEWVPVPDQLSKEDTELLIDAMRDWAKERA